MACNSKTGFRRAKRGEIWDKQGVVVTSMLGAFGLLVLKVILGSFSALVSNWPVTRKRLAVERNGVKFGLGVVVICIWDGFDLLMFKGILGSFSALVTKWPVT